MPGSGRSLGEANGYPLQYSCLENPLDSRGARQATVYMVGKSQTGLSNQHFHFHKLHNDPSREVALPNDHRSSSSERLSNLPKVVIKKVRYWTSILLTLKFVLVLNNHTAFCELRNIKRWLELLARDRVCRTWNTKAQSLQNLKKQSFDFIPHMGVAEGFFFNAAHVLSLYPICYNIVSILCFCFLALRHVGSYFSIQRWNRPKKDGL